MEKVDYLKVGKMFPNLKSGDAWIILIVPSITSFEQKLELQASGSGRIMGKEAELLIREMNSSFVPAHDLRNPEIYSMFFLFRDRTPSEADVWLCQIEGDRVNLITKIEGNQVRLGLPENLSKVIVHNIVREKRKSIDPLTE
jgi:hypothetical protein